MERVCTERGVRARRFESGATCRANPGFETTTHFFGMGRTALALDVVQTFLDASH